MKRLILLGAALAAFILPATAQTEVRVFAPTGFPTIALSRLASVNPTFVPGY